MGSVAERIETLPEWGIEPVPREHRVLSGIDIAVLWGDLGIGLLVLVTGALLVPGLGFGAAMLAIVVGSVIGVGLLAIGGAAGAEHGVPTMVLFRPVLGVRGSWFPSALNALQLVGWTAVEFWAMSFVADLVSQRLFGFSARGMWLGIAAAVCTGLALWGPLGVTRVWMKRFSAWAIVGICGVLTVIALTSPAIYEAIAEPGTGGFPTFGAALDLVIAMPISWLPLVADYNRFASRPRAAFAGTFSGYLVANVWLYALGAVLVLGGGAEPSPAGMAAGVLAIAGGTFAGGLFLFALLVGETDEAFADMYSGAVTLQNIFPGASQRALTLAIAAVAAGLAGWLTMERYETFLFLIGSVFVPLFGILIADHFVRRRRSLDPSDLYRRSGRYWFQNGVRLIAFLPWLAGFAVYHWIAPTGPEWWTGAVADLVGPPLGLQHPWLAASAPSFLAAFLLWLSVPGLYHPERPTRRDGHEDKGEV
ncbi:MAG: purine-cytosine permease family protein [Actinomycetota bacterium]